MWKYIIDTWLLYWSINIKCVKSSTGMEGSVKNKIFHT